MKQASVWGLCALAALGACSDVPARAAPVPAPAPAPAPAPTLAAADTGAADAAAFGALLAKHQRMSARAARISRALRVANAPLCADTRADLGLSVHALADYPERLRPLALHYLSLGQEGDFVRAVVPGSPADRAGVRVGDRIVSGWPAAADVPLVVDSGSRRFAVQADPDAACRQPAHVVNAPEPNASTNGREITLSTALLAEVGDDSALAFIIAHEMAHGLRGHERSGWREELQADADALVLMRNAGFDVAGTVAGWEAGVEAHRDSQRGSPTHPPLDVRLDGLRRAQAELAVRCAIAAVCPLSD